MTLKQFVSTLALVGVYGLFVCVLAFLMLIDEKELAIILSPVLPLILLAKYPRSLASMYDFRVVYLVSILIWSLGKSLSVFMNYGSLDIRGEFVGMYVLSMALAPALAILFNPPARGANFIKLGFYRLGKHTLIFLTSIWFLLTFVLYFSLTAPENDSTAFVLKQFSQGFVLVFASIVVMLLYRRGTLLAGCLIVVVAIGTLFTYLQGALNRTSLLLPAAVIIATMIAESKLPTTRTQSAKGFLAFIFAIPFFSLLLLIGDLQKYTRLNLFEVMGFVADRPDIVLDVIKNSNYWPDKGSASDYFSSVSAIIESGNTMIGGLFYQLASSIMPRIFFPEKGITDLSVRMWEQGFISQPGYYEIFLEPILDSGVIGVVIYYSLFLLFVRVSWASVTMYQEAFRGAYCRGVYILNLIVLFMIIRGPVIFIIWYALLPNIILWWWLLVRRLHKSPNGHIANKPVAEDGLLPGSRD